MSLDFLRRHSPYSESKKKRRKILGGGNGREGERWKGKKGRGWEETFKTEKDFSFSRERNSKYCLFMSICKSHCSLTVSSLV